jgi:hypothetical protein
VCRLLACGVEGIFCKVREAVMVAETHNLGTPCLLFSGHVNDTVLYTVPVNCSLWSAT